jgi:hypothetical protein
MSFLSFFNYKNKKKEKETKDNYKEEIEEIKKRINNFEKERNDFQIVIFLLFTYQIIFKKIL